MIIVVDTHALFWFLTADKRLSKKARSALENAGRVYLPTIVLLELLYIFQKKKELEEFLLVFDELKKNDKYSVLSLDVVTIDKVLEFSSKLEMHDSIIVATAQMLGVSIVTKDRVIGQVYEDTIW